LTKHSNKRGGKSKKNGKLNSENVDWDHSLRPMALQMNPEKELPLSQIGFLSRVSFMGERDQLICMPS
jgi:hypothetical protein